MTALLLFLAVPAQSAAQGWSGYIAIHASASSVWETGSYSEHHRALWLFDRDQPVTDTGPGDDRVWSQNTRWQANLAWRMSDTMNPDCLFYDFRNGNGTGTATIQLRIRNDSVLPPDGALNIEPQAGQAVEFPATTATVDPSCKPIQSSWTAGACGPLIGAVAPEDGTEAMTLSGAPDAGSNCQYPLDDTVEYYLTRDDDPPECADGVDNDEDGRTDFAGAIGGLTDFGCSAATDDDESDDPDSDGDGLSDTREDVLGTLPNNPDTDGDGLGDGAEVAFGSSPLKMDTDDDGLEDPAEQVAGTGPNNPDTDGDGLTDGAEVAGGSDPLDPSDPSSAPCDGLTRSEVIGTRPLYLDPLPELAAFPNDGAACRAVWVPSLNETNFVPQGLALAGSTAYISGYSGFVPPNDGRFERCRVIKVDLLSGAELDRRDFGISGLQQCHHGGGIGIDDQDDLWLVDTGRLFLFADGLQDPKPKVIKLIKNPSGTPLQGSFLFEDPSGEGLWIGDFKARRAYRFAYAYLRNAPGVISIDQADSVRDLPPKPNGATFLQDDLWVASSTAGCGKLTNGQGTVGFGPGAEELEFDSAGRLWAVFEAGSLKYSTAGIGFRPFFPLIAQFDPSKLVESVGRHCVRYVGA